MGSMHSVDLDESTVGGPAEDDAWSCELDELHSTAWNGRLPPGSPPKLLETLSPGTNSLRPTESTNSTGGVSSPDPSGRRVSSRRDSSITSRGCRRRPTRCC